MPGILVVTYVPTDLITVLASVGIALTGDLVVRTPQTLCHDGRAAA